MSLSREEIQHVALLARLRLDEDEVARMSRQLSQVLDYIGQLDDVNTDEVEPLAHPLDMQNVVADDEPHESLPRDQAFANAPRHDGQFYLVPPVL